MTNNINNLVDNIYNEFKESELIFGMYYMPEHFRDKSPLFHLKILEEMKNNRRLAVAAPRESAKSTIICFLNPIHTICFKKKRFIVIIQSTSSKAETSLDNIKKEFKENVKLKSDFGIELRKDSKDDVIFKHPDGMEIRILARGRDQIGGLRGEKFGAYRPDMFIIDDLEDDELVRNPQRRSELKEVFNDVVIPAGDRKTCSYVVIGTVLHDDCLIAELVSKNHYHKWKKLFFVALWVNPQTKEEESLWPEKWTVEDLKEMRDDRPDTFAKEYQNDPVAGRMSKFSKENFRRWKRSGDFYITYDSDGTAIGKGSFIECKAVIACDLAWDEKRQSDYSVILPVLMTPESDLLVDNYICEKGMDPSDVANHIFLMEKKYRQLTGKSVPVGMEKGKIEKATIWTMKQMMRERGHFLIIKPLVWDADKITRIVTRLEPRYKQNAIFHQANMGELEYQLLRFPSGVHDDLIDALQGAVQLLEYAPIKRDRQKEDEDKTFNILKNNFIKNKKEETKKNFVFGKKNSVFGIPAKRSLW